MRLQETIPSCISSMFSMSATVSRADFIISYSNGDSERENIDSIFKDTLSLAWKGYPLTFRFFYALITVIDLSSNHLQGKIPEGITQLSALVALNLSSKNLSGSIPSNIGQLQQLRFLDLSRNSLSGRIPASLSTVPFLTFLNLSFNNLFGEIPLGNQLQSFDAFTYTGNQGLCGPPLTQECPRDSITFDHHSDHHDLLMTFGFYISMFFGFIIGFWGVCGTLFLKTSWRYAYFQFFSDMNDWIYVQAFLFMARLKTIFQDQQVNSRVPS